MIRLGPADITLAGFTCNRCGNCCRENNIDCSYHDILRWAHERRFDILAKVSYLDFHHPKTNGFYITQTVKDPKESCPFLDSDNTCRIYATRPRACADWPHAHSREELAKIDYCPSLEGRSPDPEAARRLNVAQSIDYMIAGDRRDQLLLILIQARESQYKREVAARMVAEAEQLEAAIGEFGDDPLEYLYVGSFSDVRDSWSLYGSSPYLDAQDYSANYVASSTKKATIGDFGFDDTSRPYTDNLNSVVLYVYGADSAAAVCYIWNGTGWTATGISIPAIAGWDSADVSAIIDSWAKVDGAQIYFERSNSTNPTWIDAAYLLINYTEGVADNDAQAVDGLTVADSASIGALLIPLAVTEGLTLGEAITAALSDLQVTLSEGLTLADQASAEVAEIPVEVTLSEDLTLADQASASLDDLQSTPPAEDLQLADQVSASLDGLQSTPPAEDLQLADQASASLADLQVTLSEGLTLADQASAEAGAQPANEVTLSEGLTLADQVSASLVDLTITASEGLTIADAVSASCPEAGGITISISEPIAVTDAAGADLSVLVPPALSDDLTLADQVSASLDGLQSTPPAEDLQLADQVSASLDDLQSTPPAEDLTLGEAITVTLYTGGDLSIAIAEDLTLAEILFATVEAHGPITITLQTRQPEVEFSARIPEVEFASRRPEVDFTRRI